MPELALLNQLRTHAHVRPTEIAYREASTNRTITWRELVNAADVIATALRSKLPARGVVMLEDVIEALIGEIRDGTRR